jgi:hypothetical protein
MAALRKEWRVSPKSPFRQVLSGLDNGVRLWAIVRKALGTADEFLGLAQVMLDEEGKGARTREQDLLRTYRKMQALMKAIPKTPLTDKLPPGAAELCRWPLDVFIAIEPGIEIVAGHAARIEKETRGLGDNVETIMDRNLKSDTAADPQPTDRYMKGHRRDARRF